MSGTVLPFAIPPVVKTIVVPLPVETAFRLFTGEIGRWWPLDSHSLTRAAATCIMEPKLGGRVYERTADGREADWGVVQAWEPPKRVAFTWRVMLAAEEEQRIDVAFASVAHGTEVRLEHAGWEKLGAKALERRENYVSGWTDVFEKRYGRHAFRAAGAA